MSQPLTTDGADKAWSTTASSYSRNVGRTSTLSAIRLIELVEDLSHITSESHVLDVGAGTGAITLAVAPMFPSTRILATDISSSMLENIDAQSLSHVSTQVLAARHLSSKLEKASFTHVFNTFMLQTVTAPLAVVRDMYTVLAPGGVIGIGLWAQRNGPFEIWEEAARSIDPGYSNPAPFDDPEAWRTREELEHALKQVGFHDISTEEVQMPFQFDNAKAFAEFWFRAKNPASVNVMSNFKGSMEMAEDAVERVVRERYEDGKEIYTWAVVGMGRKQVWDVNEGIQV